MIKEDNVVIGINYFLVVDLSSRVAANTLQEFRAPTEDDTVQEKTVLTFNFTEITFRFRVRNRSTGIFMGSFSLLVLELFAGLKFCTHFSQQD